MDRALLRQLMPVLIVYLPLGASFGAVCVSAGAPAIVPIAMSVLIFGGSAQFAALGVMIAGGGVAAAAIAGLLINARMMGYSFAMRGAIDGRWGPTMAMAYLLTDVNVALALRRFGRRSRRAVLWQAGLILFVVWNLATIAGVVIGRHIADMQAFGLDAVFPAIFFSLIRPALADAATARACIAGVLIAVATLYWLPAGLPVVMSLAGLWFARRSLTDESR